MSPIEDQSSQRRQTTRRDRPPRGGGSWYPVPSSKAASAVMRGNRSKDTRPELRLRSALHAAGARFRVNLRIETASGPVRPDIVFTRARVAVFVDGCFWHGCPDHGTSPRSNSSYWAAKIGRNQARDLRDRERLEADGWTVLRLWEHVSADTAAAAVLRRLADPR
jgi:DNA mismatch endonuclease (patch repair protein)